MKTVGEIIRMSKRRESAIFFGTIHYTQVM